MTELEALTGIRELIAAPSGWRQREWATDQWGCKVPPWSRDATCFCLAGAALRVAGSSGVYPDVLDRLAALIRGQRRRSEFQQVDIVDWNDRRYRTHQDVVDLLDRAIAEAA